MTGLLLPLLIASAGGYLLVRLRGGELTVRYDRETGHCFMTGPAVEVFTGEWP